MCHSIGVVLANEPDMRVVFTCGRGEATGEFAPEHLDRLRRIGPHLVRGERGTAALAFGGRRECQCQAFDRVAQGVLIVAASGEVLFANRAAEAPLTEGDGIRIEKFALRASMRAGVAQFQRLIATAVEGLDAAGGVNCARPAGAAPTAECTGGAAEDRVDVVRDRRPRRNRVRSRSGQRDADRAGPVAISIG